MSDKIAKFEGAVSDRASEVSIWRSLLEHPGWALLEKILQEQYNNRLITIGLTPLASLAQVPAQEFMKGEANAYGSLRALPQTQLELAQQALRMAEVQLEKEKDDVAQETKARSGSRVDDQQFSRE